MSIISVIVPVYKVEKYIHQCIDSILSQTFTDFELILVDDGSPDNCGVICDEYAKNDNRVKVIHQQNAGLSAARNAGLDIAKGDYVTFIDSDDVVSQYMLAHLHKSIMIQDGDVSMCSFLRFENESELYSGSDETVREEVITGKEACEKLYGAEFATYVMACAKLYKSILFKDIRFPVGRVHEDTATTYKIYYKSEKVVYLHEGLYFYRQNNNGIMKTRSVKEMCHDLAAYQEWIDFYREHGEMKLASMAAGRLDWNKQLINLQAKELGKQSEIPKEFQVPMIIILRRMYHNCTREHFLKYLKMGFPFLYRMYTTLSKFGLFKIEPDKKN